MTVQNHQTSKLVCNAQSTLGDRHRWLPTRLWVNWALAALTVPVAAGAVIFAIRNVVSMAACSTAPCPDPGPHGLIYTVLFYGAPLVAALTIVMSIFTATRRYGVVVPLCGLTVLVADIVAAAVLFRS